MAEMRVSVRCQDAKMRKRRMDGSRTDDECDPDWGMGMGMTVTTYRESIGVRAQAHDVSIAVGSIAFGARLLQANFGFEFRFKQRDF